jgi:N-acetyl-gamma-glutamylphosphate reductase
MPRPQRVLDGGAAVQNLNLALGLPETEGLRLD